MPSLMAILGLDSSRFAAGLSHASQQANAAGQKIGGALSHHVTGALAGVASVAFIEEAVRSTIEWGASLVDTSRKLGISTDAVQKFDFALKQNGSSIDALGPFFMKLGAARNQALRGNADTLRSFKELGVSLDDLRSKRLEDLAMQIGEIFQSGGDPQRLSEALKDIGGRGAGDFIAAMTQGLKEAADEAQQLGIILDKGSVMALKEADDRAKILGARIRTELSAPAAVLGTKLLHGLLRGLSNAGQMITDTIQFGPKQAAQFAKERAEQEKDEEELLRKKQESDKNKPGFNPEEEAAHKEALKKAERVKTLQENLAKIAEENDLKTMTREQRLQELMKRRKELVAQAMKTADPEERLKIGEKVGRLEGEILDEKNRKERVAPRIDLNSLQRIGAYAAVPPGMQELQSHVRKIPDKLDRLITNTKPKAQPPARTTRY